MNSGRFRVFCLWLADVICIVSAWTIVVLCYKAVGIGQYDAWAYLGAWPTILVFSVINATVRLYHGRPTYPSLPMTPVEEFRRLVLSALATHLLVMAFLGFSHRAADVSRVVLAASGCLTALSAQVFRDIVRRLLFKFRIGQIPAVVVGDGRAGALAEKTFGSSPYYGFRLVRHFHREDLKDIVPYARAHDIKHLLCCYRDNRYFSAQLEELTSWFSYILYVPTAMAFPVSDARAATVGFLEGERAPSEYDVVNMSLPRHCDRQSRQSRRARGI